MAKYGRYVINLADSVGVAFQGPWADESGEFYRLDEEKLEAQIVIRYGIDRLFYIDGSV